jgi:hypothetical protein
MPSKEPPPGVVSNYGSHSGLLDFTISVGAIFLPSMYLFLGIRLYMHTNGGIKWKIDDCESLLAAFFRPSYKSLYINMRISNRNIRGDSVYHTRCIDLGICG